MTRFLAFVLVCAMGAAAPVALADDREIDQADALAAKGDYDGAISMLKKAQLDEASLGSNAASEKLVQLYLKLSRFDDATPLLQEMYTKTKDRYYAAVLADTYRLAGNFYAAQHGYEELIASDPDDERSMYQLAECLEATGNYDAARDMLRRIVDKKGKYASAAETKLARSQNESAITSIDPDVEIGRWPKSKMPLKIFIKDGSNVNGYRAQLRNYVVAAINDWQAVSHGLVTMQPATDEAKADITIGWAPQIAGALGVTTGPSSSTGFLTKMKITFATNSDFAGRALPPESAATRKMWESRDRMFREVALHEFGHALGLDHSPRSDDIMANGVYGLHSAEAISERGLQPGDIERLTQLYSLPEDAKGGGSKEALAAAMQKVLAKLQSAGDTGGTDLATGSGGTMRGGNPYIQSAAAGGGTGGAGQHNDPHTTAMRQAMFALQGGKFTECVEILKDVIKTNPRDAQAHYIMAVACVNLRDYAGAQREYEQVLKLAPSGRLAELASAGLSKIKK